MDILSIRWKLSTNKETTFSKTDNQTKDKDKQTQNIEKVCYIANQHLFYIKRRHLKLKVQKVKELFSILIKWLF